MSHFLLIYDRSSGTLVRQTGFGTSAEAIRARFEAELEYRGCPEMEIVALSAESEEALRRTHGRYFMSLSELAGRFG